MRAFDAVAATFERERALPADVPAAIRRIVVEHGGADADRPILEVGCGTGRIGAAFSSAGDPFCGVDISGAMLREFQARAAARPPHLVQADARALPFGDGRFGAVLMMHVLTAGNWRALLEEARRVLDPRGALVIGKAEGPPDGVDAAMRQRLHAVLADLGVPEPPPKQDAIAAWLGDHPGRQLDIVAATWTELRRPRDFFARKQSAGRFRQLPEPARAAALETLADWAERAIGPLDAPRREQHRFRVRLHWFQEPGRLREREGQR